MKTKIKAVSKISAKRVVAAISAQPVVPLRERRLNFGTKWDYAPAPEESKNYVIAPRHELFINGKFVKPHSGKHFDSINPATEDKLTEIALGDEADVDRAVKAARRAYEKVWGKMPGRERGKYLYRIARIIQEKSRELAVLESMDGGKPIKETRDVDLPLVAAHFFYHAGWADKLKYAFPGKTPQPLGVAGQIIPWNFPLLMAAWKIAPAIACGNTVVIKPSKTTSITLLRLAQIFQEAELPEGVVNVVTGVGETGTAIVQHPDVNKIAFTGSTEVGKQLAQMVVGTGKRITLELGGKAANIIFEDAPIDQAIEGIIAGIYFNMGHVCCAGSRLLVQESIFPTVVRKLRDRIQTLRLGNPLDKNTDIGAINNKPQLEKIRELVQSGVDEGAEVVQTRCTLPERGYWYPPTFLTGRHGLASRGAGGNFRTGARRDDVPHPGGSRRTREQHALRPERRRVDGQGQQDFQDRQPAPRRRRLGEHLQQVRSDQPVWRLQGKRLRPRRRIAGSGGLLPVGLKTFLHHEP